MKNKMKYLMFAADVQGHKVQKKILDVLTIRKMGINRESD